MMATFTITSEIESRIDEFFKWPDRKVLMLKGPWGAGKSYFLRNYIRERVAKPSKQIQWPTWISYASLFGCSSMQAIEDRVFGAIQPAASWNSESKDGWLGWGLKQLNIPIPGLKVTLPLPAIIWRFMQHQDSLIVLDDLERTEGLTLGKIMGLVSSIAETSSARIKFIMVCNSEQLGEDNKQQLAIYREKVIHTELLYNPAPSELAKAFFYSSTERDVVVECLAVAGQANIRIIRNVHACLRDLTDAFRSRGIELPAHDRQCIVRSAMFFYLANQPIRSETIQELTGDSYLAELLHLPWFSGSDDKPDKRTPDPLKELAKQLQIAPNNLLPIVCEWLENGNVAESRLASIVAEKKREFESSDLQARKEKAMSFIYNFKDVSVPEIVDGLRSFLSQSYKEATLNDVRIAEGLLEDLGEPYDWTARHVNAVVSQLDERQCHEYLLHLEHHPSKSVIQERLESLRGPKNPKEVIWRMVRGQSWNNGDWEFLASKSADFYEDWFLHEDDQQIRHVLRGLFDLVSDLQTSGPPKTAMDHIATALRRIRDRSQVQQIRLQGFPLSASATEDSAT